MISPDKSSSSSFIYGSTFSLAIFLSLIIVVLYTFQKSISMVIDFNIVIWLIIPFIAFILGLGLNIAGQYIACNNSNIGIAFSSSWPIIICMYSALLISLVSYIRAPVTSLFVQMPNVTVIDAEKATPAYKGLAVGFYVFWAVVFGQVFSSGMSQVCIG
jgi:hypothetical protein